MASLKIELPDELERTLAGIAEAQHKSLQELAMERLLTLVDAQQNECAGSAAALLRVMREPPHLSVEDVDELDAAIA